MELIFEDLGGMAQASAHPYREPYEVWQHFGDAVAGSNDSCD